MGMNLWAFSAAQKVCSKLENQAKCNSADYVTNPLKNHFSQTFWLLEVAIIARMTCNCNIGHRAQPVLYLIDKQSFLHWTLQHHQQCSNKANALHKWRVSPEFRNYSFLTEIKCFSVSLCMILARLSVTQVYTLWFLNQSLRFTFLKRFSIIIDNWSKGPVRLFSITDDENLIIEQHQSLLLQTGELA